MPDRKFSTLSNILARGSAATANVVHPSAILLAPGRYIFSVNFWLVSLLLFCVGFLLLPVKLAIGGYYWDVFLYPDAAWRIANGQLPHVDFFTPAGAFEYYGYALLQSIFPNGHQLLLAQWSLLLVTLPVMAAMATDLERQGRYLALAVVLPFVFFSLVPINTKEVYPLAGVDGYGIYNRHVCLLLYVMVTTFVFVQPGRKIGAITGILFAALFFVKVTGAAIALPIIALALLSGRMRVSDGVIAAATFAAICIIVELSTGMVSAYVRDIGILVGMNAEGLVSRLRSPLVMYLDVLAILAALAALLLWVDRSRILFVMSSRAGMRLSSRISTIFNHDALWIAALCAVGILFETQNTGSLALVFVWPYLAQLFARWFPRHRDRRTAVLLLVAVSALPMLMPMMHRTARVVMGSLFYEELQAPALGRHAQVEAKQEMLVRAQAVKEHFADTHYHYRRFSEAGHQSSYLLYTEIDYQLSWLMGVDEAVQALRDYERDTHRKFERLIVLDFVDVFTPVLRRTPVKLISIGMAAERTVPPLEGERLAAAMTADALLVPRCPTTPVRLSLQKTFAPVMEGKRLHRLSSCWDLLIRD
jgi:hypothetical protein